MAKQRGFSLIELLIVVAIILIIAAIGVPYLLQARVAANDSSAASSIRTINTAEVAYITAYPSSGYAAALATLGPPSGGCSGTPNSTSACLLDDQLGCATAPCTKSGYKYYLTASSTATPIPDYTASATPLTTGMSGSGNLCSNTDAIVRSSSRGATQLPGPETSANCANTAKYTALNH